jgi:hypothetical protein
MKFKDFRTEEKVRLDPKCWTGKKIGNPKTKVKGGVRVNNCVPAESVEEAVNPAQQAAIAIAKKKKKQGLKEGTDNPYGYRKGQTVKLGNGQQGRVIDIFDDSIEVLLVGGRTVTVDFRDARVIDEQGVAEDAVADFLARGGEIQKGKLHKPRKGETWQGSSHIGAAGGKGTKGTVSGRAANTNPKGGKPVVSAEGFNPEYNDEAGMADNNLETLERAVAGIDDLIQTGDNLPEWCQEKIAVAKSMLVAVWDYMESEEDSEEVDPEVDEMFEAMQDLVSEMAQKNRVSEDLVWEQFEAMPDNVLYETAAWRRKEGKSAKGGLNAKGVASYRRENPGSKLQTAVTTKPSKLKPGSKAAKRRKSFCARMGGVKGPMKKPNGKPTRKALALRKWNC